MKSETLPALFRSYDVFERLRILQHLAAVDEALVGLGHAQFMF